MRHHFLLCAPLLLASGPAAAQTLAEAIAEAYRSNPTIESSRYDVRAADEDAAQARAELRPTVNLDASADIERTVDGRLTSRQNFFSPSKVTRNSNQLAVTANQPLFTSGRASADRDVAEASVGSARAALRGREGDLLLAVITAFVDVRRYQAELDVWRRSVAELEAITKEIEARQEAGELTRTDIAQARAQLESAREQVVATEQALESARDDYRSLVGTEPGTLAPEPALPRLPSTVGTAFDLAEKNNPELAQAVETERGSRAQIASARAAGGPTVSLQGSATLSGQLSPYNLRDQDQGYTGRLVISLPLSAGGRTASQIRQAQDRNSGDRLRIEAARREMVRDVNSAWNQMVASGRAVSIVERRIDAAETQLDGMINEYRVGLRSTFDVLFAQQTLRDAQVEVLDRGRDRYLAQATLLRRTGLLEVATLTTGVDLYDPALNLSRVERRGKVPWEVGVGWLDRLAVPRSRPKAIDRPGKAVDPQLVSPPLPGSASPDFSRTAPLASLPGTDSSSGSPKRP